MVVVKCEAQNRLKSFFILSHPDVFGILGHYNLVIGLIVKLTSYIFGLMDCYKDLLVMCISLILATRFQQVNKILLQANGVSMPTSFYVEQKLYHRSMINLANDVDNAISSLILLALSSNFFFICLSLFNSL
jgi:hypothetical protein